RVEKGQRQAHLSEAFGVVKTAAARRVDVMGSSERPDNSDNAFLALEGRVECKSRAARESCAKTEEIGDELQPPFQKTDDRIERAIEIGPQPFRRVPSPVREPGIAGQPCVQAGPR